MTGQQIQQLAVQIAVEQNRINPGSYRQTLENAKTWLSSAVRENDCERQSGADHD